MGKQWHGGKGDKPRQPDGNAYSDGWELAFGKKKPEVKARKVQPDHSKTAVHRDKTKPTRSDYKTDMRKQRDLNWDGNDD
jgi:hypothetical protein